MVYTKQDVLEILDRHEEELANLGVRKYALFGSFLHDTVSAESDVDLLVEFDPDAKTFLNFTNLVFLLEDLLGRSVEVVTVESLSSHIGPHILRQVEYVSVDP